MAVKTRSGKNVCLRHVNEDSYDIVDGIYGICNTPMYAGQTARFYSFAENSCHIYDYIVENMDSIIDEVSKNKVDKKDVRMSMFDLSKKDILLYALMTYMAYPFMLATVDHWTSFDRNNSRILAAFLRGLGHSYKIRGNSENNPCYIKAKRIIDYAAEQIKKEIVEDNYYNKDAKYMYYEPSEVIPMFISRFNKVAPFQLYILNKSEATAALNYYLPKIKMA